MVEVKLVRAQRFSTLKNLYVADKKYTVSDALATELLSFRDDDGLRYFSQVEADSPVQEDPVDGVEIPAEQPTPEVAEQPEVETPEEPVADAAPDNEPTPEEEEQPEVEAPEEPVAAADPDNEPTPPEEEKKAVTKTTKATKPKRGTRRKPAAKSPVVTKKDPKGEDNAGALSDDDSDLVEV